MIQNWHYCKGDQVDFTTSRVFTHFNVSFNVYFRLTKECLVGLEPTQGLEIEEKKTRGRENTLKKNI